MPRTIIDLNSVVANNTMRITKLQQQVNALSQLVEFLTTELCEINEKINRKECGRSEKKS